MPCKRIPNQNDRNLMEFVRLQLSGWQGFEQLMIGGRGSPANFDSGSFLRILKGVQYMHCKCRIWHGIFRSAHWHHFPRARHVFAAHLSKCFGIFRWSGHSEEDVTFILGVELLNLLVAKKGAWTKAAVIPGEAIRNYSSTSASLWVLKKNCKWNAWYLWERGLPDSHLSWKLVGVTTHSLDRTHCSNCSWFKHLAIHQIRDVMELSKSWYIRNLQYMRRNMLNFPHCSTYILKHHSLTLPTPNPFYWPCQPLFSNRSKCLQVCGIR